MLATLAIMEPLTHDTFRAEFAHCLKNLSYRNSQCGIYRFIFSEQIRNGLGGSGTGGFNFTLTAADGGGNGGHGGEQVPDAGSTALMLAASVGALGIVRHHRRV